VSETGRRSADLYEKRNALVRAGRRPRHIIYTPFGREVLTGDYDLLEQFAEFLAGKHPTEKPHNPPRFLRKLVREADPRVLALAGLAQLLDAIFRGLDPKDRSWEGKLKLKVGEDLNRRLQPAKSNYYFNWSVKQRAHAGNWLITQAMGLDFFSHDANGLPCIADKVDVAGLRKALIAADPSFAPFLKPPPPWTFWSKTYDDGFRATFVRDFRPETEEAISAAFLNPFEHAEGVNHLSPVALEVDTVMLALGERFAVDLMGNVGAKRKADETRVAADVADAKWCVENGPTFWLDYNCDRRGRIYALQHFNFAREDHVRSMFRFARGMKLEGDDPTYWLEIHLANCAGHDKKSRAERRKWVNDHSQDIQDIANDPFGTFDRRVLDGRGWKIIDDSPLCFVAACLELAAAWKDPENFVTHLPIGFDGSANGLQHLSLLIFDMAAAEMVNLFRSGPDDTPRDVYGMVSAKVIELIEADHCEHALSWRDLFKQLEPKQQRKLLKRPGMTFSYSVTVGGAADQIEEAYYDLDLRQNVRPDRDAFRYLAKKALEACKEQLKGPELVMNYIKKIAKHRTKQGRFLEWTSPSGFPVENRYQKPNNIIVECRSGEVRTRHKFADGVTDKIKKKKALSAAAPNFVHSLDAAHLVKVVNGAASKGIELLTIHDCFYCLAPQATRLREIILDELASLYRNNDPLAELRSRNVTDPDILPVPHKGAVVTWVRGRGIEPGVVIASDNGKLLLELLKEAENGFG
jgi:DNA-directed RNA polymerase